MHLPDDDLQGFRTGRRGQPPDASTSQSRARLAPVPPARSSRLAGCRPRRRVPKQGWTMCSHR
jgi:hypothetical protein